MVPCIRRSAAQPAQLYSIHQVIHSVRPFHPEKKLSSTFRNPILKASLQKPSLGVGDRICAEKWGGMYVHTAAQYIQRTSR